MEITVLRPGRISRCATLGGMWDADLIRERISRLAQEDPALQRFGARRHRYAFGPVLAEREVREYEERHSFRFPAAYRDFLLTVGNGGAGPYYGLFRHDGSEANWLPRRGPARIEPGSLARPFPHVGSFQLPEAIAPCPVHPHAPYDVTPAGGTARS